MSLNKSGCFLCHLSQLSNIPRDEEFSLVIYTAQSLVDKSQVDICTIQLQWELCFPFMETADAILIDPLSKLWTIEPQQVVESILHSPCSDMLLLDMHDAQLVDQLSILRQTWIVFYPSGYQMEGMKMIEEHAAQYIEKLKNSCNVNLACNVNLNHLSTTNIENTLYKARHYIREYFQTLHACKPRQDDTDNQWSDSFLLDIQHLIALHTLRTSYDYVQHDGLYGASKYLDTAHKRYGSMLPCMKTLQNMLEDLGQVDKLLHPKTDIIVKTSKQLKHIYEQQRRCLPNFRGVPFRILVVATTRYTAYMLKRDLYNRGLKNNSGIDIVERKCVEDIRQYYAILDLTLLEWKPTSCLAFHETLSHWPIQVATQLYEWIMSQVVQYRCVIVDRNNNIQVCLQIFITNCK